jgi:thioesterase-3
MEKIFYSDALIRFSDCDPLGHLNNMRYLDYFLNAREDQLIKFANFDIYAHSKATGQIWVMFQNKITYLRPVFYTEVVLITSQVTKVTDKSIHVEMQMKDKKSGELKAVLWMIAVYIDMRANKSVSHPPDIAKMLNELYLPVTEPSFDDRVRNLQYNKI